jgi:hypothetical protein
MPTITKVWSARQVFETWWIRIPPHFRETFVQPEQYWHAYDDRRSVSLTSTVVAKNGRPVPADALARQVLPAIQGAPIDDLPDGLLGRAAIIATTPPAMASRALSGMLVSEGRVLIATITSDDIGWAREVWMSIAFVPARLAHRTGRSA